MDMRIFDNDEDDGQLSLFGMEELVQENGGADIRIGRCSGCGKLLFVREEKNAYLSECSNCGVRYFQKKG